MSGGATPTVGRRGILASLILSGVTILVCLGVAEVVARLARVSVGTVQINRGVVRLSANPRLGFELRPSARVVSEVEYRINAEGFRGPEPGQKSAGRTRIAVFGDSIVFGYWVAEADAFPAQIATILEPRVEVLNLGVPGYNLEQEIENLRERSDSLKPDLVLFGFCLNDLEGLLSFEYGLTQARKEARTGPRRFLEGFLSVSRFAAWIEYRLTERDARARFAAARNPLGGELYDASPEILDAHLDASFTSLSGIARAKGIDAAIVIFPVLGNRFENYPYKDLHARIAAAAARHQLSVVDLLPCFRTYEYRSVRVDVVHPNPLGHRIAAHGAAEFVQRRLFPNDPPPAPLARGCASYRAEEFPKVRGY